jgi:hypothetical protein
MQYRVYCDDIYVDDLMFMVNNMDQLLVYDKHMFLNDHVHL